MKEFRNLGLIDPILKVIEEENFDKPSDIQKKAIPLVIQGKDILGGSATGSGKTLAFGSGIIQNCERIGTIQSLVLTPTRELAEQIKDEIKRFARYKSLSVTPVYGGVSINPQIHRLQKTDVVVGTPGRILDHISRNTIDLSHVKILVLDEADRMLDMGFIDDVKKIMKECPNQRQTLLFSATIGHELKHISQKYMNNPIKVSVETRVDPRKLRQSYYDVQSNLKFSLLVQLLKHDHSKLVMVFCNSKDMTDFVARNLKNNDIKAIAIHGGLTQDKRKKTLSLFNDQKAQVLVCTDVAARGLDIKGVSHVYNYDIPKDTKQYIHRVGRTARAGENGKAVNLLSQRDHANFYRVQRDYPDIEIKKQDTPYIDKVETNFQLRRGGPRRGNFRGHNQNKQKHFNDQDSERGNYPKRGGRGNRSRRRY